MTMAYMKHTFETFTLLCAYNSKLLSFKSFAGVSDPYITY